MSVDPTADDGTGGGFDLWSFLESLVQLLFGWLFAILEGSDPAPPPPAPPPPPGAPPISPNSYCTCLSCTDAVWSTDLVASSDTCGTRIESLQQDLFPQETDACARVAAIEFPDECGACDPVRCDGRTPPPPPPTREFYCGCETCTLTEWKDRSDEVPPGEPPGLSCEARATWLLLLQDDVPDEASACRLAACAPPCHPDTCHDPPTELYCFPNQAQRVRYENVWSDSGGYVVEVKEAAQQVCGPGSNRFVRDTVSLDSDDRLTLQFRYDAATGDWVGSEVRVLLPSDADYYSYGTYEFSVESVRVVDTNDEAVVSENELPASLVLGLFTWDATDDFASHENWNHEVDIEFALWDDPDNPHDAQFLVQPAGDPQLFRFATAGGPAGHRYRFTWNPGSVEWSTDAGGGQSHSYSTQEAVVEGRPDYVQCLPANMEVRMNLWNLHGVNAPTGLTTDRRVEVIIDDFSYTPSGLTAIVEGGHCSKDCQCETACVDGLCGPPE